LLRILGLVATIALGDSLNPSTIGPALYIASGERARIAVLEFTLAVFVVHLAGGAILVLGPGKLVVSLVNKLDPSARDLLELGAGVALMGAGIVLWAKRRRLRQKDLPSPNPKRKSAILLGATIIAAELPTAFPYFAAIAAILGLDTDTATQVTLLGVYNLCFILPLVTILITLVLAGQHADELLTRTRRVTQRRWPEVFAVLLSLLGLAVAGLASVALVSD
jgi:cytochrome c biogenesis protein CcdA